MLQKIKYLGVCLSIIIIIVLVVLYFSKDEVAAQQEHKAQKQNNRDQTSEQYKMYFNFDGDKSELIDLIQGKAEFNIVYSGNSKFTAKILHPDGTFLTLLADVNGPYNQRQIVDIPETGVYVLDVKTLGDWSLSRK